MRHLLLALLLSCAQQSAVCPDGYVQVSDHCTIAPAEDGEPDLPSIDRPAAQAQWGPAEIETEIEAALIAGFPEVWSLHDTYLEMLTHGDALCPGHETYIDDTWLYGCTAESGYWYAGVSEYWTETQYLETAEIRSWVIAGDFEFRDTQGGSLAVGGGITAQHWQELDSDVSGWFTEIQGSWIRAGEGGWLEDGVSGAIQTTMTHSDTDDEIWLSGAVGFSDIQLYTRQLRLARSCDWGMTGALSVRDPGGAWHEIVFGNESTSCGRVSFQGEPMGEVCPNLDSLVQTLLPYMGAR